ncbi:TIGR02466 family protein [Sphingomonas profundi]|uniref:TIGR02466 family protein n=1 Tax=Alterirhizorhabdus profundi TaxID=2681549 RepID=UPI0012E7ACB9|nr:TIGR02466 family protein [Sphingomonas profundi]
MPSRSLFVTRLYEDRIDEPAFLAELADACRALAAEDRAGRAWSRDHGYRGYTSYASLADLPQRDPRFADLVRRLARHVAAFAGDCAFDLGGRRLKLDSLWVNVLKPGGAHGGHIHPHSVVSGTVYVVVPEGAGALRLEDPRLPLMMAAPTLLEDAPDELHRFVKVAPRPGTLLLWESWLRHEVIAGTGREERISVSFNYR